MEQTHDGWPDDAMASHEAGTDLAERRDPEPPSHIDVRRVVLIAFVAALLVAWIVLLRVVH